MTFNVLRAAEHVERVTRFVNLGFTDLSDFNAHWRAYADMVELVEDLEARRFPEDNNNPTAGELERVARVVMAAKKTLPEGGVKDALFAQYRAAIPVKEEASS